MLILEPQAPRALPLGRGVVLTVTPLDTFAHGRILAFARREVEALAEDRETKRDWELTGAETAALADDPDTRAAVFAWMRAVLVAEAAVTALEGVADVDGVALTPSFSTFAQLFRDAVLESRFAALAFATEQLWAEEGNVSGRGQSGAGAMAPTTAQTAAPLQPLAQTAASSPTSTADALSAALPSSTSRAPTRDTSSGASVSPPDSGAPPA